MKSKDILIKVNQLYKIFGEGDKSALDLVKNGMGKDELLEKSNCVLGLNNINLNFEHVLFLFSHISHGQNIISRTVNVPILKLSLIHI